MIPISQIRNSSEEIKKRLLKRGEVYGEMIDKVLMLDERKRSEQKEIDDLLAKSNSLSKEIAQAFQSGNRDSAEKMKEESSSIKEQVKSLEEGYNATLKEIDELMYQIPNAPNEIVPFGHTEDDNEVVAEFGEKPSMIENAQPHWDLAKKYDLIDFELGNKITGAGFPVYKGKGARLQRALINFFLDNAMKAGYNEVQPPILVNEASGYGTGQLPDKEGQMYYVGLDNLYLIPTAEVPITNLYRDVIVNAEDFPIRNVGYTPCFRREAGSYGAHVRGLNRLHQFDKVEIVQIVKPEDSYKTLDEMVDYVKTLLNQLELPYRILRLCGGDIGFTSALTYDFEVYSAAQERWLEVSSVSNFEAFQTNRLKLRYKNESGKTELAHSLNGSALALPRIVAALLENNQVSDGINMPKSLHSYLGFEKI